MEITHFRSGRLRLSGKALHELLWQGHTTTVTTKGNRKMQFPEKWLHVKVDLFDNASKEKQHVLEHEFKLSLTVIVRDNKVPRQYRASMTSHKNNRFVRRGVEDVYDTDPHYQLVESTRQQLSTQNIRHWVSKFYPSGAKNEGCVRGITGFVCEENDNFVALVIVKEQVFHLALNKDLTSQQVAGNLIGTFSWGSNQQVAKTTRTADELF